MLSPRWRKVLRDLWSNKTRTLLVVLSIAVGVFAVGMIASSQMILANNLSTSYAKTNPAHAILFGRFDDETIITVRRMEEVKEAEGRGSLSVQLLVGADDWRNLDLTAIPDFDKMRISKISHVRGAWPPDKQELLIEQASLEGSKAKLGDTVLIELDDGRRRRMRISGVVHDLGEPLALFDPNIKGYINLETQEWLGGGRRVNQLQLLTQGAPTTEEEIKPIADAVKDKLEKGGHSVGWVWIPKPGEHWADEMVEPLMLILGVLGLLSLVLSGFLVINTISALLTQQTRQIGVMKTIGARTGQLLQMYLTSVIIFGLLSLLVAVPLGAIAAHRFVNFIASLLNFYEIGFHIPPLGARNSRWLISPLAGGVMASHVRRALNGTRGS